MERFADLGKRLECSRIVYATPTTFTEIADVITRAKEVSVPMRVEVWEAEDLVDPPPVPEGYIEPGGDLDHRPEPSQYLRNIVAWAQRHSTP